MSYFKRIDTQIIQIREGGGCLSIFGLPFFAAGIFLLLASVKIIPFENASDVPEWSYLILLFMGVIFTLVGGGLMFGRSWKTIDLSKGCVTKITGTILPFLPSKKEELYLADYSALVIRYNSGDSDTAETYPISLVSKTSGREFQLYTAHQYSEAIAQVEKLAEFISFPVEDRTSDHVKIYESGKISRVFEQCSSASDIKEDFTQPLNMKSRVTQTESQVEIFIPGPDMKTNVILPLVILLFLIYFGPSVLEFFEKTHTPAFVQYFFIGFAVLFFLVPNVISLIYTLWGSKRKGTFLRANKMEVILEVRSGWSTKRTKITASEIVDLDYSTVSTMIDTTKQDMSVRFSLSNPDNPLRTPYDFSEKPWFKWLTRLTRSKGVIIKSKQGICYFGHGLDDAEVRYLYSIIKISLQK